MKMILSMGKQKEGCCFGTKESDSGFLCQNPQLRFHLGRGDRDFHYPSMMGCGLLMLDMALMIIPTMNSMSVMRIETCSF